MSNGELPAPVESFMYRDHAVEIFLVKKRPDHCGLTNDDPEIDCCAVCRESLPLVDKYVFTIDGSPLPTFDADTADDAGEQAKALIDGGKDNDPPATPEDTAVMTPKPTPAAPPAKPQPRRDRAVTLREQIVEKGWPEKVAAIFDEYDWKE